MTPRPRPHAVRRTDTIADLSVAQTGPLTAISGTEAAYTVTITNNGPSLAQGVTLTDALNEAGLTFDPALTVPLINPDGFAAFTLATPTSQSGMFTAASVAAGSSDTFRVVVQVASSAGSDGTSFSNTASVSSKASDTTQTDNTATVFTSLTNSAELSIVDTLKTSGATPITEGSVFTYNLKLTNNGPSDAQNVLVNFTLPTQLNTIAPIATLINPGTGQTITGVQSGNILTFTIPTVSAVAGDNTFSGTVTVQGVEDGTAASLATVTSTTPDPTSSNNTANATTAVAEGGITLTGGVSLSAPEFTALNGVKLATFTHAQAVEPPGSFSAIISWGDGSNSSASVILTGTTYAVVGSHTYSTEGNYSILVAVSEDGASATAASTASVSESLLPPGIPQNIATSTIFAKIEDSLRQPFSLGQFLTLEANLPTLLLQTAQTLIQQGQNPELALLDIVAGTIYETMDDTFHQPLSPGQLQSIETGLISLLQQNDQTLIQQGQSPEQALLSSFYLSQAEFNLFATVLNNNGTGLGSAVNEMLDALLLQSVDISDANSNA